MNKSRAIEFSSIWTRSSSTYQTIKQGILCLAVFEPLEIEIVHDEFMNSIITAAAVQFYITVLDKRKLSYLKWWSSCSKEVNETGKWYRFDGDSVSIFEVLMMMVFRTLRSVSFSAILIGISWEVVPLILPCCWYIQIPEQWRRDILILMLYGTRTGGLWVLNWIDVRNWLYDSSRYCRISTRANQQPTVIYVIHRNRYHKIVIRLVSCSALEYFAGAGPGNYLRPTVNCLRTCRV